MKHLICILTLSLSTTAFTADNHNHMYDFHKNADEAIQLLEETLIPGIDECFNLIDNPDSAKETHKLMDPLPGVLLRVKKDIQPTKFSARKAKSALRHYFNELKKNQNRLAKYGFSGSDKNFPMAAINILSASPTVILEAIPNIKHSCA